MNKNKIIILLLFLFIGCATIPITPTPITKQDGLYIDHKLVKKDATVEDFCKAKGRKGLFRHNKEVLSEEIK